LALPWIGVTTLSTGSRIGMLRFTDNSWRGVRLSAKDGTYTMTTFCLRVRAKSMSGRSASTEAAPSTDWKTLFEQAEQEWEKL